MACLLSCGKSRFQGCGHLPTFFDLFSIILLFSIYRKIERKSGFLATNPQNTPKWPQKPRKTPENGGFWQFFGHLCPFLLPTFVLKNGHLPTFFGHKPTFSKRSRRVRPEKVGTARFHFQKWARIFTRRPRLGASIFPRRSPADSARGAC